MIEANLQEADLEGAILTHACLWDANLRGTRVTETQLRKAMMLHGAIMPDGHVYDGSFDLPGDIALANETKAVDDVFAAQDELPVVVRENEIHARQFLRWKWLSENIMDSQDNATIPNKETGQCKDLILK